MTHPSRHGWVDEVVAPIADAYRQAWKQVADAEDALLADPRGLVDYRTTKAFLAHVDQAAGRLDAAVDGWAAIISGAYQAGQQAAEEVTGG